MVLGYVMGAIAAIVGSEHEASGAKNQAPNMVVNFATGGAMTGDGNRVLECLGGLLRDCAKVEERKEELSQAGLILPGVSQQIDWAVETLDDRHPTHDLYLLFAGANDFYGPGIPSYTAETAVANLATALDRMYNELDAKYIVVSNCLEPCSTPFCSRLQYMGFHPSLIQAIFAYSPVWAQTFDEKLQELVATFNADHPDATVIFVDTLSKVTEILDSGNVVTEITCQEEMLYGNIDSDGNPKITGPDENGYYNCSGFAWTDAVHPTSNVWKQVAEETIVPTIKNSIPSGVLKNMDRLITIGDSYNDLGTMRDTLDRVDPEWGESLQSPPAAGTMAQNGPSLTSYIEDGLGFDHSLPYLQP